MQAPEFPPNEQERLAALRRLSLTHVPDEQMFDRIVRVAQHTFGVPIAHLSLVEEHRIILKSVVGLPKRDVNRSISFCGHAVLEKERALVIENASVDPRFSANPFVLGDPKLRFYAGRAFKSPDGFNIGTLCVLDIEPRRFSREDEQTLNDLAMWVEMAIAHRDLGDAQNQLLSELDSAQRQSLLDPLLMIWNRRALDELLPRYQHMAESKQQSFTLAMVDVDHFKRINDKHGHCVGDEALKTIAEALRRTIREPDALGRWGGEEYMLIFANAGSKEAPVVGEKIRQAVRELNLVLASGQPLTFTVSVGLAVYEPGSTLELKDLVEKADKALYRAKELGRDRVEMG